MGTLFSEVYNCFLGKITDDLYIELTPQDTLRDLQNLLLNAIPGFEFPRKDLTSYTLNTEEKEFTELGPFDFNLGYIWGDLDEEKPTKVLVDKSRFTIDLTQEEINILALLMLEGWTQRQITSIENTRMKYSGPDFKMTSQANHLSKLLTLLAEIQRNTFHMQRLYKRRKLSDESIYQSNWSVLRTSALD